MRIVKDNRRGVETLLYVGAALEAQSFVLRPCRNPRKRKVGHKVVVVEEPSNVAVAAREKHFYNLALVAFERNILKELPRLVA